MRTSLNNIQETEDFILNKMSDEQRGLFNAKLLLSPMMRMNLFLQKKTYSIIKSFGRKQVKHEINVVHKKLFSESGNRMLQQEINKIFNP